MKTIHKDFDHWIDTNYSRGLAAASPRPDTGVSIKEYEEIANCGKDVWFQTDPHSAPEDDPEGKGRCYVAISSLKVYTVQELIDNLPERVAIMTVERLSEIIKHNGKSRIDHFLKVCYSDMTCPHCGK